jgi:hypothetical protein
MKFIINFIVTYLAISLIGFFLCLGKIWTGMFLLTDVVFALMLFNGDLNKYIGEDFWGYLVLFTVTGKIIVCLVIAGAVLGLQGVKKNE